MNFLDYALRCEEINSENIKLYMYFIQKFLIKYPSRKLQFTGKGIITLNQGDEGYEDKWRNFEKNCGWFIANKIPITSEVTGTFVMNPKILKAAIANNEKAFLDAFHANSGHIYTRKETN